MVSLTDYYPYGMDMPGRSFQSEAYRYGYQGSERDPEMSGGAGYTTFFRALDPRIGRWLTPDPKVYPWQSPYVSMDGNPVAMIDPWGASTDGPDGGEDFTTGPSGGSSSGEGSTRFFDKDNTTGYGPNKLGTTANHFVLSDVDIVVTKGNNTPIRDIFRNLANQAFYFVGGTANAWASDNLMSAGHHDSSNIIDKYKVSYISGQLVGHAAAMITGIFEALLGLGGDFVGAVLTATGFGSVPGVVVIAGSTTIVVHGGATVINGAVEFGATSSQLYYAIKRSGSEEIHKNTGGTSNQGTRVVSKTMWKGKGKERIDVENPNPSQRRGQVHYQDNDGNKYIYDPSSNSFPNAPKKVNDLLNNRRFKKGIEKGLKYLGEIE
ncbi:RHS repeat-associated core domain-containing protein [Geofilum sp. OHC36d9]|uniref:RHS repeat-associated core domain-containing protein n=1 Tax=Geofilum sp. OHC36d9 TaxID=3458413 RepID=UPI0040340AB8